MKSIHKVALAGCLMLVLCACQHPKDEGDTDKDDDDGRWTGCESSLSPSIEPQQAADAVVRPAGSVAFASDTQLAWGGGGSGGGGHGGKGGHSTNCP